MSASPGRAPSLEQIMAMVMSFDVGNVLNQAYEDNRFE
jgi:hypothetical protein